LLKVFREEETDKIAHNGTEFKQIVVAALWFSHALSSLESSLSPLNLFNHFFCFR